MKHMEGITTTGTLYALIKFIFGHTVAAAIAAGVGFLLVKPKTVKEAMLRIFCTLFSSFMFGPALVSYIHHIWPWLFEESIKLADADGLSSISGIYVTWPIVVMAGLPAWWVLGWFMRFFDNRKDKDALQVIEEVKDSVIDRRDDRR